MKKRLMILGLLVGLMAAMLPGVASANYEGKSACKKGGWMDLVTADGAPFANQGACVSYVARGGTPIPKTPFQIECEKLDGTYVQGPKTYLEDPTIEFAPSCEWQGMSYGEFLAAQVPLLPLCDSNEFFGFWNLVGDASLGCFELIEPI